VLLVTDNPLWDVIQEFLDDPTHRFSPRVADLSRETGVSEQVFSKWKQRPTLPEAGLLLAVSQGTGISYGRLLVAALAGKGYAPLASEITFTDDYQEWLDNTARAIPPFTYQTWDEAIAARRSTKHPPRRRQD
jgi:hypothetical protein